MSGQRQTDFQITSRCRKRRIQVRNLRLHILDSDKKKSILLCKSKSIFAWDQILDEKIKLKRVKRIMPTWDFANMVTSNRKQNLFNKSRQFFSAFDFGRYILDELLRCVRFNPVSVFSYLIKCNRKIFSLILTLINPFNSWTNMFS